MKFFVDTAEVESIKNLQSMGLIDGVTTNPSLIVKSGRDFKTVIAEICELVSGPVSAEVAAMDAPTMIREGELLAALAPNVVVKLPMTLEGLKACHVFTGKGIKTNVTLCFSATQALLAARVGATYVSPFVGRLDDIHINGIDLIDEIRTIYDNYHFDTAILAASIRNENHVKEVALAGADVATVPPSIITKLVSHPLTDKGLEAFVKDWESTGQSIV